MAHRRDRGAHPRGLLIASRATLALSIALAGCNADGSVISVEDARFPADLASPEDLALLSWPNAESSANSDPWLIQHHDELGQMKPQVLALNFINVPTIRSNFRSNIQAVVAGLNEGSLYHG